ncbi:hypothetical protein BH10ACT10_BH10ACT10_08200 [soil metagenome]
MSSVTNVGRPGQELNWKTLLDRALTGEGVSTVFPPLVDLVRGVVVGYEALTRFTGYPVTNPQLWFEASRRERRSADLEALALRSALAMRSELPSSTFLAVNIAPDLLDEAEILDVWETQDDLHGIVVELTEHARIDSYATLESALERLRAAGARIAIDDAGAGYAGLQHLIEVRPNIIKLDLTLVAGVDRDETKRALVEMIGSFASRIDAVVLAEGIEHLGELDAVIGLGVPLAQGYLLARPAPPWAGVDRRGAALLRQQMPMTTAHTLRQVVERAVTVDDEHRAAAALTGAVALVVILDDQGRPVATMDQDGLVDSALDPSMRVDVDTSVTEAAERAMTRPTRQRFRPLLCVDGSGLCVGVARMERVLTFLTSQADAH